MPETLSLRSDQLEKYMRLAIAEATSSLREHNSGFGAVIVRKDQVIVQAHDTDTASGDPTAHAEMTAIRSASAMFDKNLNGCLLIATHEPCPMCSTAILWAGIRDVAFGFSIKEGIQQGRKRIDIPLKEIFQRAAKDIRIHERVLHRDCSVLYNQSVRDNIRVLRDADEEKLTDMARSLSEKRIGWYANKGRGKGVAGEGPMMIAYRVFLEKLGITEDDAPVVHCSSTKMVIHSKNFCPTLEACRILGMDTRFVCRHLTEIPTTNLLRQIHPGLRFARNYDKIRPHSDYCEEMIVLE